MLHLLMWVSTSFWRILALPVVMVCFAFEMLDVEVELLIFLHIRESMGIQVF